jgi:hypothetical protein
MRGIPAAVFCLGIVLGTSSSALAQARRYTAEQTVTIRITGLKDEETRKYVLDRLPTLLGGKSHSQRSSTRGNVTTVTLAPVTDVQAFADKIEFGEATVSGRTINLKITKLNVPGAGADALTKVLLDTKSPNVNTSRLALEKLAGMSVQDDRKAEVSKALEPLLASKSPFNSRGAAKALGVWGTKDSFTALSEAADSKDPFLRREILEAMGNLKDERAVDVLVKHFAEFQDRAAATKALTAMGASKVEVPFAAALTNKDWTVRMDACKLLGTIGTKKSLPALEKAAQSDENGIVKMEAGKAVAAIKSRGS